MLEEKGQNVRKPPALHGGRQSHWREEKRGFQMLEVEAPLWCRKPAAFPGHPVHVLFFGWGEQRARNSPWQLRFSSYPRERLHTAKGACLEEFNSELRSLRRKEVRFPILVLLLTLPPLQRRLGVRGGGGRACGDRGCGNAIGEIYIYMEYIPIYVLVTISLSFPLSVLPEFK